MIIKKTYMAPNNTPGESSGIHQKSIQSDDQNNGIFTDVGYDIILSKNDIAGLTVFEEGRVGVIGACSNNGVDSFEMSVGERWLTKEDVKCFQCNNCVECFSCHSQCYSCFESCDGGCFDTCQGTCVGTCDAKCYECQTAVGAACDESLVGCKRCVDEACYSCYGGCVSCHKSCDSKCDSCQTCTASNHGYDCTTMDGSPYCNTCVGTTCNSCNGSCTNIVYCYPSEHSACSEDVECKPCVGAGYSYCPSCTSCADCVACVGGGQTPPPPPPPPEPVYATRKATITDVVCSCYGCQNTVAGLDGCGNGHGYGGCDKLTIVTSDGHSYDIYIKGEETTISGVGSDRDMTDLLNAITGLDFNGAKITGDTKIYNQDGTLKNTELGTVKDNMASCSYVGCTKCAAVTGCVSSYCEGVNGVPCENQGSAGFSCSPTINTGCGNVTGCSSGCTSGYYGSSGPGWNQSQFSGCPFTSPW